MPNSNPWRYWLEDTPSAAYQSSIPSGSPSFTDYWKKQQGSMWGEYQGALGKQVLAGQPPSLQFTDFLRNYPWTQRWMGMSPSQRGINQSQFSWPLQWRV